ncbi:UDP-glucosyltransferase 29 [Linum perenne]
MEQPIIVYLCSSPINLASVTQLIKHHSRIQLVELNLPSLPDLPPHSHTTKGLPIDLLPTLFKALNMATSDFSQILTKLSPDLLIYDFFQPWAPKLALSLLKIPIVLFMTNAAFSTAVPFTSMKNSGVFPLRSNFVFDYGEVESLGFKQRVFQSLERSSEILIVQSFREIEVEYIDRVSEFVGKSVLPIGPLVPDDDSQESDNEIINWLNKKAPSSVVYISFGSESYLSRPQIDELAHALLILIDDQILVLAAAQLLHIRTSNSDLRRFIGSLVARSRSSNKLRHSSQTPSPQHSPHRRLTNMPVPRPEQAPLLRSPGSQSSRRLRTAAIKTELHQIETKHQSKIQNPLKLSNRVTKLFSLYQDVENQEQQR